jgi:ClpP class serine protease/cell division protein FtsL
MNGTFEIFTNKEWMILPSFVHGILPTLMDNANNRTMLGIDRAKKNPMCINAQGDDIFREYEVTEDGTVLPVYDGWNGIDYLKDLKQPFVNVIPIDGPITRNGGACSYGSKDIRDWMMKASDNPYCQCHVLVINTQGGSAWAKNDFQQAIDYAHSMGMRVIAFIDGLCASAGMYLASLCDEVYVMNLKDQLGCVGVMASFFTMKSGDKNQFTNETYREYYATKSVNKNKEIRDIAENDDATELIAELDQLEAEFRADMKKAFPNATDEYLDGRMFDAVDVMGIFCDGQMLLGDVIARGFALGDGSAKPIERTAGRKIGKRAKANKSARMTAGAAKAAIQQEQNQAGLDSAEREQARPQVKEALFNPLNNSINMKEKFPQVFALLGVEEMECNEEGSFLNASLLETLNGKIAAMQQESAQAKESVESLTKQVDELKAAHEQAISDLNAEHTAALEEKDKAIADMEAAHKEAIEAKDAEIATLTEQAGKADEALKAKAEQIETLTKEKEDGAAQLSTLNSQLSTLNDTIAEREQQISDLNAQITELTTAPGNEPAAGAAPQNNGGGAEVPVIASTEPVAKKGQTYDEMRETWDGKE